MKSHWGVFGIKIKPVTEGIRGDILNEKPTYIKIGNGTYE